MEPNGHVAAYATRPSTNFMIPCLSELAIFVGEYAYAGVDLFSFLFTQECSVCVGMMRSISMLIKERVREKFQTLQEHISLTEQT